MVTPSDGTSVGAAISLRPTLAGSKWLGVACPHCSSVIALGEPVVLCPSCYTPHHAACWRANGNVCAKDQTPGRILEPRGRPADTTAPAPVAVAVPIASSTTVAAKPAPPPRPTPPAAKAGANAIREAVGLRPMEGVKARIQSALAAFEPVFGVAVDEVTVTVSPPHLPEAARLLKLSDGLLFDYLRCLSGVDYQSDGIEVVYHLFSTVLTQKCVLKTRLPHEGESVGTVTSVWAGANWHERETAEMFNIRFSNHPYPEPLLLERDDEGNIVPGPLLLKRFKLRPKEPPAQYGFAEDE